jgi:hypothetical protein
MADIPNTGISHFYLKKHQIPSTCLRRSGFVQAGQIKNKFQSSKFKCSNKTILVVGKLDLGIYLEFGIWNLGFETGNCRNNP